MRYLKGLIMALSMFSAIPMPRIWDDKAKNLVVPALPIVGVIIGLISYGFALLISMSSLSLMIKALLILLIPLLLTGFIHVDGLMDTSDAVFSRAEPARKIAILKDSHVGSFAVIAFCIVLLIQFAAVHSLLENRANLMVLIFIPVTARAVTSLFVLNIPAVLTDGYAKTFREKTQYAHTIFISMILLASLVVAFWLGGWQILAILLIQLTAASLAMVMLYHEFKGISGDLSGFILTVSETTALLAAASLQGVWR